MEHTETVTSTPFTICLWFDTEAEEAAHFYTAIFSSSTLGTITRYGDAGPRDAGMVMTAEFELNGQPFMALNGGPGHEYTDAISLVIPCEDQAEVDHYWNALTDGGEELACGWLKDRYGLRWQVVPTRMIELMRSSDTEAGKRAFAAMMQMTKLDVATLEAAAAGTPQTAPA